MSYTSSIREAQKYFQDKAAAASIPNYDAQNGRYNIRGGAVIVGKSPQMLTVFYLISKLADERAIMLLLGESGTGKDLI